MNQAANRNGFDAIFQNLRPHSMAGAGPLPVQAPAALSRQVSAAWPELIFSRPRASMRATASHHGPSFGSGLVFQPGLLRPSSNAPGLWPSSTIAYSWKGAEQHPGLGSRLLARGDAMPLRPRGDAVASAILAHQIGGEASPLSSTAERALTGATALVAGNQAIQDAESLNRLLRERSAEKIVVLTDKPFGKLARMGRRAGATILPLSTTNAWAAINLTVALHAPPHTDIAVLAKLAGRTLWTADGIRTPDPDPGLVAAAYLILGTRYMDPSNSAPLTCEAFIDRLLDWQRLGRKVPPIACFVGISFWKRRRMAEFAGRPVRFTHSASRAVTLAKAGQGGIAVWPSRAPQGLDAAAATAGIPVFRVEDGFIRSRGLGADFIPPASVIIDRHGIYYDASQPSDLEAILSDQDFTPDLLNQARRLMDLMIARRITKYNLGGPRQAIKIPAGRRPILVPGQVANDLSVKAGGAGVAPGLALLAEVRRLNPGAFIIYKPHPDVEAGHRPGAVPDDALTEFADLVVRDVDMPSLIETVEEVHTVTSLTGFEALLRGRHVVTYGRPFYAGWGLTTDIHPPPRRGRALRIEELVAGTLILYPHYLDPFTHLPCGPEHLIEQMDRVEHWRTGLLVGLRRGQGLFRRKWGRSVMRRIAGVA